MVPRRRSPRGHPQRRVVLRAERALPLHRRPARVSIRAPEIAAPRGWRRRVATQARAVAIVPTLAGSRRPRRPRRIDRSRESPPHAPRARRASRARQAQRRRARAMQSRRLLRRHDRAPAPRPRPRRRPHGALHSAERPTERVSGRDPPPASLRAARVRVRVPVPRRRAPPRPVARVRAPRRHRRVQTPRLRATRTRAAGHRG